MRKLFREGAQSVALLLDHDRSDEGVEVLLFLLLGVNVVIPHRHGVILCQVRVHFRVTIGIGVQHTSGRIHLEAEKRSVIELLESAGNKPEEMIGCHHCTDLDLGRFQFETQGII